MSDKERLIWLDRFARAELPECSPPEVAAFQWQLSLFFGWQSADDILYVDAGARVADSIEVRSPGGHPGDHAIDLRPLQRMARKLIKAFVSKTPTRETIEINAEYELPTGGLSSGKLPPLRVKTKDTLQGFALLAMDLLRRSKRELGLEFKPCPDCEKSFVRVRRQLFCSTICRWRTNKRLERKLEEVVSPRRRTKGGPKK